MLVPLTSELKAQLKSRGVESFHDGGSDVSSLATFEPPCSIKWISIENEFQLGAFSYAVSGYFSGVSIGRYTSIGEAVQVGRSNHPLTWVSTSPFFYLDKPLFDVGATFDGARSYHAYGAPPRPHATSTQMRPITIGNDVYVGHGAMIMPGVSIGDGAIVGAMAVVTKNVPPYAIVGGNPARIIRMRLPMLIAAQLLHLQWWRFAPWQLTGVDFSDPTGAIEGIKMLAASQAPFVPEMLQVADLMLAGS